jgi:hypothetical protein
VPAAGSGVGTASVARFSRIPRRPQ